MRAYHLNRLYLFGSVAWSTSGPDSDYDLLVVVPDDVSAERRQSRVAYEALRGTGIAADVLVCTQSCFADRLDLRGSLPATIVREGVLLHVA